MSARTPACRRLTEYIQNASQNPRKIVILQSYLKLQGGSKTISTVDHDDSFTARLATTIFNRLTKSVFRRVIFFKLLFLR